MNCRHCREELHHIFVDLDFSPISNAMLTKSQLQEPESHYPLKVFVCANCSLVQIDEMKKADKIFDEEYTYFSSYSTSWLAHAKAYVDMMMDRFKFNEKSQVIEIASNDGYLLQYFKERNVPVLGIDPTKNTAREAEKKGIETLVNFFTTDFAEKHLIQQNIAADLILGNNVLAHVPDINDFVRGMKLALNKRGIITMEFPHLLKLVEQCQFDTIYHEHFSYLSFIAVKRIFESFGLSMFDVQEIPTHGGSLRIFAKHHDDESHEIQPSVNALIQEELEKGIDQISFYQGFQNRVDKIKYDTLDFLIRNKRAGKKMIGYGAAAKGNTLLNYCGIKGTDLIDYVVDASPYKQDKYLPGSHIPVLNKDEIKRTKPDYVIILPWNLKDEISQQLSFIRSWGGQFVVCIPEIMVF
ncbi:MAG: class I SAM-dependent methyltransferase [bacterium]|jgi:SAM-dependent methyltransferase